MFAAFGRGQNTATFRIPSGRQETDTAADRDEAIVSHPFLLLSS